MIRFSRPYLTLVHSQWTAKMAEIVGLITDLYRKGDWKAIVEKFHDHPERNRVLWVYPSEENFVFLDECLRGLGCDRVVSVGCGSGLLEWMLMEATGLPVAGVEIDQAWWHCKYAPPTFIPLLVTSTELDEDVKHSLSNRTTALLFCYFNNGGAFEEYLRCFGGEVLVIIGPGEGKPVHTDPKPFGDVGEEWRLYGSVEVRNSLDFIAVYVKE